MIAWEKNLFNFQNKSDFANTVQQEGRLQGNMIKVDRWWVTGTVMSLALTHCHTSAVSDIHKDFF